MIDRLEAAAAELVFQADVQGYIDARANSLSYLRAAHLASVAADHLAAACESILGA